MDGTSMLTCTLIVRRHPRRFTSQSPSARDLCGRRLPRPCRGVSSFNCSFSFVFFNIQHSNLRTFKPSRANSFPHNLLSDPHPLNPVLSIFYKNTGGGGPVFPCHPERSEGSAFSLLPYFLTSLLRCFFISTSERLNHVPQPHHFANHFRRHQ